MKALEIAGLVVLGAGAVVALLNFYLSFLRSAVLGALGKPHRFVSGLPLIGTILLVAAGAMLRHRPAGLAAVAGLLALDTGGLPWFVISQLPSGRGRGRL